MKNISKNQFLTSTKLLIDSYQTLYCRVILLVIVVAMGMLEASANAATYYVATNGNDSYSQAQAQSTSTPWKTIQHAAVNMSAGDTCSIRAGTYRETVAPANSGNSALPITFQAYGDGDVVISGTDTLPVSGQSWTLESTNIYYTYMDWTLNDGNQVFVNQAMVPEARWPNAGATYPWQNSSINPSPDWAYVDTAGYDNNNQNGWLTDTQLPSRPDGYWNGCKLYIIAGAAWNMSVPTVTNYVNATKKLTTNHAGSGSTAITAGDEYYLAGKKEEMDSNGEWFYDTANSRLYLYATGSPSGVEAKRRNYGFDLTGKSYITLTSLHFFACTINTSSSSHCIFDGLLMQYMNHNRTSAYGLTLTDYSVLRNSELSFCSGGLILLSGNDNRIINNNLHDSDYNASSSMIINWGWRNLISHNTMHDSGRSVLSGSGCSGGCMLVEYNDMYNAVKLTLDCGIVYDASNGHNSIFRYNMLHDSPGRYDSSTMGFYEDNYNSNWVLHHNIIWNVPGYAMQFNCRHNFHQVFNNTCWNAKLGALVSSAAQDGESGDRFYNNLFNSWPYSNPSMWHFSEFRYNLFTDPQFVDPANGNFQLQASSPAINHGALIPGITDGYAGATPDIGALEYGGTNWTVNCGYHTTPPSPDPAYVVPDMNFCNKVQNGSFEISVAGSYLSPNWTVTSGSNVSVLYCSGGSWSDSRVRSGIRVLKCESGTSEVRQTVSGLLPNQRYVLYGGIKTANTSAVGKLGVRNYGGTELSTAASTDNAWHMYNLAFTTGSSNSTAQIYISATVPGGDPVYADDFSVELCPTTQSSNENMDQELVARWKMDESSWSGIPGEVHDSSGNNFHLTSYGGANTMPSPFLLAGSFDGTNDYVKGYNSQLTTITNAITVAGWVKLNSTTAGQFTPIVFRCDNNDPNQGAQFNLGFYPNTTCPFFIISTDQAKGAVTVAWNTSLSLDVWYLVSATYDTATHLARIYVNAINVAEKSVAGTVIDVPSSNYELYIGWRNGWMLNGLVDELSLWRRALSESEIIGLYENQLHRDLVAFWRMDESSWSGIPGEVHDSSGNNFHLTSYGGANTMPSPFLLAGSFDGTNDYVKGYNSQLTTITNAITVAGWVKLNSTTAGQFTPIVFRCDNNDPNQGAQFNLGFYPNTTCPFFIISTDQAKGAVTVAWNTSLSLDVWYLVSATYDTATHLARIYVNAINVAEKSVAGTVIDVPSSNYELYIGWRNGWMLNGLVDELGLWRRALSDAEIMNLYEAGTISP